MTRTVMTAAVMVCVAAYSVTGMGEITANRTVPSSTQADQSVVLTFALELDETETDPIHGFYYADHIPSGLTVTTDSVRVDGVTLDPEDYTYEAGWSGEVYPGCVTSRWIVDMPASLGDHPVSDSVVIQYRVESAVGASYTFPNFNWVGVIGGSSAFGYDETDPAPVLEVEGEGGAPLPEPVVNGTPLSGGLGLGILVSLLAFAALLKSGTKAAGHD